MSSALLCSDCFRDRGLAKSADKIGILSDLECPACRSTSGAKLDLDSLLTLCHRFFVWGSLHRTEYGGAPVIQFNIHEETSVHFPEDLSVDVKLIEGATGVGFFYYGPNTWMIGDIEPLRRLQDKGCRKNQIKQIIEKYPRITLSPDVEFFRVRVNPSKPSNPLEFDAPPLHITGSGRLDSEGFPILYASEDLDLCMHECRVAAEDQIYFASMRAKHDLYLLDLTELLNEPSVSAFDSIDISVHMLFLAGAHSYQITRDIAKQAHQSGYDGVVYPSYFSMLKNGQMPFESTLGLPNRQIPSLIDYEQKKIIANFGLFGRPLEQGQVEVKGINRAVLQRVSYDCHYGPIFY